MQQNAFMQQNFQFQQNAQIQMTSMNFNNNYDPNQMNQNPNFYQPNMYGYNFENRNQSISPNLNPYQNFQNNSGMPNGVAYNNNYQNKYFNGVPINKNLNHNK
jgi:hypothetical protein